MSSKLTSILRSKLSPAQQALLEKRLEDGRRQLAGARTIPRYSYQGTAPLSYGQQWFWYCLDRWSHGDPGPIYIMPLAARLKGPLKVSLLQRSLNEVIRRHETLRTTFPIVDGSRMQVIAPSLDLPIPLVNLRDLPEADREMEVRRLIFKEARRLFDLSTGPLLRVVLLQVSDDEHVLLLTMHHIITDGWSMAVLTREIATLYEAFSKSEMAKLPELPIRYGDFAIWEQEWMRGEKLETLLSYWKQQLAGAPLILQLPLDRPRPSIQTTHGGKQELTISNPLVKQLRDLSIQEKASLYMTLLSAFNILLYGYTGQEDILVGSPVAGRHLTELEGLIGYFANNVVLRTRLAGDLSFLELLKKERDVVLVGFAHQDMPFLKLVETLQPELDLTRSPVIQILFVLENTPAPTLSFSDLSLSLMGTSTGTATRDLTFFVYEYPEELQMVALYNSDLFDASTIKGFMEAYRGLLEKITADPQRRVSELVADKFAAVEESEGVDNQLSP